MTQEQAERLCKADPLHFKRVEDIPETILLWSEEGDHEKHAAAVARFDELGQPDEHPSPFLGSCLWWMLNELPRSTIMEATRRGTGFQVLVELTSGMLTAFVGATRKDALIDAYCNWYESRAEV